MKFFIVFALCVAAASARFIIPDIAAAEAQELNEILAAINHPSTDPATASALLELLNDILGVQDSPIHVGPAIVDEAPVAPSPVIVDENESSPIHVGPVIIDESDLIDASPVIVDEPIPSSSPLVQIIINVKSGAAVAESPVVIEDHVVDEPSPIVIEDSPAGVELSPVIVVDNVEEIVEQPIINAPVFPSPAVVLPDALN